MDSEYYLLYVMLRKAGLIGKLWADNGQLKLAPINALTGLEYQLAEFISEADLFKLLDSMFPTVRKSAASTYTYDELYPDRYKKVS